MSDAGWAIRFYDLTKDRNLNESTRSFISNFSSTGDRQNDKIRVFRGMYGIDNYLIWEVQRDLPNYDFKTVGAELKLFLDVNSKLPYFKDYYRIIDIKYDPNQSRFVVFCLSEDSLLLKTRLMDTKITPPIYLEKRTGIELLKEMFENVLDVVEHKDYENTKDLIHFSYRYLNFNPHWTVYELISYIATESQYEWYLENRTLHIGHALHALDNRNCTKPIDKSFDHLSYSHFFFKVNLNPSPINVLGHFNKAYRCVWVKHWAGTTGGITKGAFVPIGWGHLTLQLYVNCLEGDLERNHALALLSKTNKYPGVTIGSILEDEGGETIKSVSVQKSPNTFVMKTPNDIIIDRVGEHEVILQKHELCRTTPYLDHNAGILFPSPYIANEPPPNSILFNVNNRGEATVVGPYVYGSGRDGLIIPVKNKGDFRLQLPNGACIYIKENNEIIIQLEADPESIPGGSGSYVKIGSDGIIYVNGVMTKLQGGGHKLSHGTHQHKIGNLGMIIPPHLPTEGTTTTEAD